MVVVALLLERSVALSSNPLSIDRRSMLFASSTALLPTVPRQDLMQDFAVLLMRSSYNAVDALDFVAMDDFQRQFFLLRQDAWGPYRSAAAELGKPPQQGLLTDATYFDFISCAQYKAINQCLRDPKRVFEEAVDFENSTVIYRQSGIEDADLAEEHEKIVGDVLLDFVSERADGGNFGNDIEKAVTQILGWFVVFGFAASADVRLDYKSNTLDVKLLAPANLWGLKNLSKDKLTNDYVAKVIKAYLRNVQLIKPTSYSLSLDEKAYTKHRFKLPKSGAGLLA